MRILYCHYLADDDHPAARMVHAIANELELLGHTLRVHRCLGPDQLVIKPRRLALNRTYHTRSPWVAFIKGRLWFARTLLDNLSTRRHDKAAILSFRPDIILAREDAYRTSIVSEAVSAGIPLVTYSDAPVAYESRTFRNASRWHPPELVEYIERWWLKNSQAVITPSRPSAIELRKYKVEVPIYVAPNGVNPSLFPVLGLDSKQQYRQQLGLPLDKTIIGFHGSFRNFHGIDLLCGLIDTTLHRDDIHWLLIGDGPDKYKVESRFQNNAKVTLLGAQPPEEMGKMVGIMDIGVSSHVFVPGSFYLCPLKILEYASTGCAVIASSQGDIPEMLDFGRVGLLVDNPDVGAWANALCSLLDDRILREQLGESARSWVHSKKTWQKTAAHISDILESIRSTSSDKVKQRP